MSRFNCKVKPIIFGVTLNRFNKELVLRLHAKNEMVITQKHLDFYLQNYDCFKEVSLSIGKVWFFKLQTENG